MTHKRFYRIASFLLALVFSLNGFSPALAAPPDNDDFADATPIPSLPYTDTVDITEASVEPDEPASCFTTDRTAWYSLTPTETVTVRITRGGTTTFSNLTVFHATGPAISDLEFFWCPLYNPAPLTLEAGEIYYIQAGAYPGEVGTIQVNVEQVFPPDNDNFANAEPITSLPFHTTVDISDAWYEPGEVGNCITISKSVWYSFTPSENMLVSADTLGSSVFGAAAIYLSTGAGISDLGLLGCTNNGSFSFLAEAGQIYYIQLGAYYDAFGTVDLNFREIFPPDNDNFADAQSIDSAPFSTTIDNSDATNETGEPHWCVFLDRSVWYSFTPTETMVVQVDTQGSSINSNLNIYHAVGSGFDGLSIMSCINNSTYTFLAEAGQTYYFQAGGIFGETGTIQIDLQQVPPPANDDFADAMPVTGVPSSIDFGNLGATFESGEPVPACVSSQPPYNTVWFAFTPTQEETISASIINSSFSPFLAVYTGSGLNGLTEVGCATFSASYFHVIPGQTYYIQVGALSGGFGTGTLLLETAPPPQASFYFFPTDASRYDLVQFIDSSSDPANMGVDTWNWNFGDGSTATSSNPSHQFTADGDYPVTLTVVTVDGRTASTTNTVQIRTHDVSVMKVTAPKTASVGQTRPITVSVRNLRYPETVRVDLYKSVPAGDILIGTLTLPVPASSGNRTTSFTFNYTFTSQDAQIGKATFRAVATIEGNRDAFQQDNEGVSTPTRVGR